MLGRIHGDEDARHAQLDFSVNVLAPTPHPVIRAAAQQSLDTLGKYPDPTELAQVSALIAHYHQVEPSQVLLLHGAAEGFSLLNKLQPQHVHIIHPGFSEPQHILEEQDIAYSCQILNPPFDQLPALDSPGRSSGRDLVIVSNPTNPTGVLHTPRDLRRLGAGRVLVVDEAFLDIVSEGEQASMIPYIDEDNVLILRSLTKTWSIPGLRLGYAVAAEPIIATLRAGRSHWPCSNLQLAVAKAIFTQLMPELPAMQQDLAHKRQAMVQALEEWGIEVASKSVAPYVLVRPPLEPAQCERVRQRLLHEHRIAIRRCDTFPGLGQAYWRLAVRDLTQVEQLLQAYAGVVGDENAEIRTV